MTPRPAPVKEARGSTVFGIVRPCTHRLSEGLRAEWTAHLCGLCLALRGDHGQFARVATNYDGLIVSVLTEAQTGRSAGHRRTAGPCPLRGMRTAPVARGEGARLAAAVSLVLASAKMRDHVADRDGLLARRPVAAAARRVAARWDRAGARTGADLGFDTALLVDAVDRQAGIEALAGPGTPLLTVTEPTETATAAAFAHTAVLAGRPGNAPPLAEAGRLFGRLAHLLDAVEDRRLTPRRVPGTRWLRPAPPSARPAGCATTPCTGYGSRCGTPNSRTTGWHMCCSPMNSGARWTGRSAGAVPTGRPDRSARRRRGSTPMGRNTAARTATGMTATTGTATTVGPSGVSWRGAPSPSGSAAPAGSAAPPSSRAPGRAVSARAAATTATATAAAVTAVGATAVAVTVTAVTAAAPATAADPGQSVTGQQREWSAV